MPRGSNRPVRQRKVVSHYSDDNPNTFTVKPRKGGTAAGSSSSIHDASTPIRSQYSKQQHKPSRKRKAPPQRQEPPQYDTILAHRTRVQPIFPLPSTTPTPTHQHPALLPGLPNTPVPPIPVWKEYSTSTSSTTATPSSTPMTWLSIRWDDHRYAVTGDANGCVWLLGPQNRILRTLPPPQDDEDDEQAVVQVAWAHDHVVVLSRTTLWCARVPEGSLEWRVPVRATKRSLVVAPVVSVQREWVLWCTQQYHHGDELLASGSLLWTSTAAASHHLTSLVHTDVLRWGTAVWERSDATFLSIVATTNDAVELCRCSILDDTTAKNTRSVTIHHRAVLPLARQAETSTIQQHHNTNFTFVCGRGVRMYQTSDLVLLTTVGESVQLHGQVTQWSRCCWLDPLCNNNDTLLRSEKKRTRWLEHADVLSSSSSQTNSSSSWRLLCIPHPAKGPLELQSTLYCVDDRSCITTREGPPKGCWGDVWLSHTGSSASIVVVGAERGRLLQLKPEWQSDFPGVMYPVGFCGMEDGNNIEYIEDEDELDRIEDDDDEPILPPPPRLETDPELVEAMRQSLLEQSSRVEPLSEPSVQVLASPVDDDGSVGAWPEIRRTDSGDSLGSAATATTSTDLSTLLLPHHLSPVRRARAQSTALLPRTKPGPVKRRANIEILLQNSMDTQLRCRMGELRESWVETVATTQETVHCPACQGRLVFHVCGQREMPIDHDAIARAAREKEEQEQAEKQRRRVEKRKLAEARRKEAKRQRKLEEIKQKMEEDEARRTRERLVAQHRQEQEELERARRFEEERKRLPAARPMVATPVAAPVPQSPYHGSTFHINGNEVQPSTSLHPTDALAALAGLADSLSRPIPEDTTKHPPTFAVTAETPSRKPAATKSISPLNLLSSASVQVSEDATTTSTVNSPASILKEPPTIVSSLTECAVPQQQLTSDVSQRNPPASEVPNCYVVDNTHPTRENLVEQPSESTKLERPDFAKAAHCEEASQMALSALVMLCGAAEPIPEPSGFRAEQGCVESGDEERDIGPSTTNSLGENGTACLDDDVKQKSTTPELAKDDDPMVDTAVTPGNGGTVSTTTTEVES